MLTVTEASDLLGGENASEDVEVVELAVPIVAGGFVTADADIAQGLLKWRSIYGSINLTIYIIGNGTICRVISDCDMMPLTPLHRICRRCIGSSAQETAVMGRLLTRIEIEQHSAHTLLILLGQDNLFTRCIRP